MKMKNKCRHKWYIGAGIATIITLKNGKNVIKRIGTYILCDKCRKIIRAYDRKYLK